MEKRSDQRVPSARAQTGLEMTLTNCHLNNAFALLLDPAPGRVQLFRKLIYMLHHRLLCDTGYSEFGTQQSENQSTEATPLAASSVYTAAFQKNKFLYQTGLKERVVLFVQSLPPK